MTPTRDASSTSLCSADAPVSPYVFLLQVTGLALAYFAAGKLGAFLAIQPGYATAVWPSSGIALAGVLLFGYRAWPGIFLGSILVNLSTVLSGIMPAAMASAVAMVPLIGAAAALQAVIGAYLVRRFGGFPNCLASEKEVFPFMFYGGVLSTLINPTLAVTILLLLGQISQNDFVANWLTWWIGDAIGVFIFAPLILVWMLRPAEVWKNRRIVISLALITTFALISALMIYAAREEEKHIEFEFDKDSNVMMLALEKSLSMHMGVLNSVKSYFSASTEVERAEFHAFVKQSLSDWYGVHALTWNPRIQSYRRDSFEQAVRREGYANFYITELDSSHQPIKAGDRAEYVPAVFIEPFQGNEKALGYDVSSEPVRREAMERARDTGEIAISARTDAVMKDGREFVHLVFTPVYSHGASLRTVNERRHAILGYAIAILHVESIVENTFRRTSPYNFMIRIKDRNAALNNQTIYDNTIKGQAAGQFMQKEPSGFVSLPSRSFDLKIGGRVWQFEIKPDQEYIVAHRLNNSALILLIGLLLSSLVGSLVMILSGRDSVLQKLVEKRTFELQASYEQLGKLSRQVPGVLYQFQQHPDGHFSFPYSSSGITDVYEVTPEQVKNDASAVFAIIHADDFDEIAKSIAESAKNMTSWRREYRVNLPVKGVRWLLGQANPERLADGSVLWHGYIMDITEQKQAESRLRMLSTAVEQSPTSVVITNLDAEIEYANPRFTLVTGYSLGEAIGKNPRVLQSGMTDHLTYEDMWRKITSGQPWSGNFVNKRKNGEIYYEEAYISPVRDVDGVVRHYVAVKLDISERKKLEDSIRAAAQYTRSLIESSLDPLMTISTEGKITDVNKATEKVTGVSRHDLIGTDFAIYFTDPEKARLGYQQVFFQGTVTDYVLAIRHVSGKITDVIYNASVYRDEHGEVLGVFAAARDITERKELEDSIHQAALYTRSLIESTLDPMVTISAEGKITDVNAATENVTGVSRADLIGTDFAMYFTDPKRAREGYELAFSQGSVTNYMLAIQHLSGLVTDVLYNASVYRDEAGKVLGVIATARDVTDIKRMQEEMRQLAFYDPLTRLANRRLLIDRMDQVMAASKRNGNYGALMFLDLDNFKPLNDTHGHEVGDLLLIEVAKRLKACVRKTDTVARIGGDEFVVMLSKLSNDKSESIKHAGRIAEKIRTSIAEPYLLKVRGKQKLQSKELSELTVEHHCSASIGVAMFLGDKLSQDDVMRRADDTMYQAKANGRNQVLFHDV